MAQRGRPRLYDEETAIAAITRLFWERGWSATSMQDLVDASHMQRGSLYGALGNKKALLLRALERYRTQVEALLHDLLEAEPVVPALRTFLTMPLTADGAHRGCLMGNTAVERPDNDVDIARAVAEGFATLETALHAALERAYDAGELPRRDAGPQARMLMALQQGLQVISRGHPEPERFVDAVDEALRALR